MDDKNRFPLGGLHSRPALIGNPVLPEVAEAAIRLKTLENASQNPLSRSPSDLLAQDTSVCGQCGQMALLWVPDLLGVKFVARVTGWVCDACRSASRSS